MITTILKIVVMLLVTFLVTAAIYLTTERGVFKRFYHDVLGWHKPTSDVGHDGASFCSVCKYCGKRIMQDSQGNWFEC